MPVKRHIEEGKQFEVIPISRRRNAIGVAANPETGEPAYIVKGTEHDRKLDVVHPIPKYGAEEGGWRKVFFFHRKSKGEEPMIWKFPWEDHRENNPEYAAEMERIYKLIERSNVPSSVMHRSFKLPVDEIDFHPSVKNDHGDFPTNGIRVQVDHFVGDKIGDKYLVRNLSEQPFEDEDQVTHVFRRIVSHAMNLLSNGIHYDIKPENFAMQNGEPHIIDKNSCPRVTSQNMEELGKSMGLDLGHTAAQLLDVNFPYDVRLLNRLHKIGLTRITLHPLQVDQKKAIIGVFNATIAESRESLQGITLKRWERRGVLEQLIGKIAYLNFSNPKDAETSLNVIESMWDLLGKKSTARVFSGEQIFQFRNVLSDFEVAIDRGKFSPKDSPELGDAYLDFELKLQIGKHRLLASGLKNTLETLRRSKKDLESAGLAINQSDQSKELLNREVEILERKIGEVNIVVHRLKKRLGLLQPNAIQVARS